MLEFLHILQSPDTPDCSPLNNTVAGDAPMCVATTRTGEQRRRKGWKINKRGLPNVVLLSEIGSQ
jgi:hypothetical protein